MSRIGITSVTNLQIVAIVMAIIYATSQFLTQRMMMAKNTNLDNSVPNPMMQSQKIMLYVMPFGMLFFSLNVQIGVVLYLMTTNVWTIGQQFYTLRNSPMPGSQAEKEMFARNKAKEDRKREDARREGPRGRQGTRPPPTAPPPRTACRSPGSASSRSAPLVASVRSRGASTAMSDTTAVTEAEASELVDAEPGTGQERAEKSAERAPEPPPSASPAWRREGDIAADYLEGLLDIADLDGDIDMDVEGDRASVSIVGGKLSHLVGSARARSWTRCRS